MPRKKGANALLLRVKSQLSVEEVKLILNDNVYHYNRTLPEDKQLDPNLVFNTPYRIGDKLEIFLKRNFSPYSIENRCKRFASLSNRFIGNLDELSWKLTNSGEFIKTERDYRKISKTSDTGEEPFAIDYQGSTKRFRNLEAEFIANNKTPEIIGKLNNFVIVEALYNDFPEDLVARLKYDLRIKARPWK